MPRPRPIDRADHPVWFVTADGVQPLDLAGPHEVFAAANRVADGLGVAGRRYALATVSLTGGPIAGESGLAFATEPLPEAITLRGTLVIPGGDGMRTRAITDPDLVAWTRRAGRSVDRVATVCTGAFLAAEAGLLDHHRVATHWAFSDALRRAHPDVVVDDDAIWARDGNIWSSAGVTAGIDLALAIVEHDLGPTIAQSVARWLVVFLRRPGGQSQFSSPVWSAPAETAPVRAAQELIHADPAADLSVDRLASMVGLSGRHLTRRFQSEIGESPSRYVETIRVEAARRHLESSTAGVEVIARMCGFGSAETLRRAFHRRLGVGPAAYRQRFAQRTAQPGPAPVPARQHDHHRESDHRESDHRERAS